MPFRSGTVRGGACAALLLTFCVLASQSLFRQTDPLRGPSGADNRAADPLAPVSPAKTAADRIVNRAKQEARNGVRYDASYRILAYPGGDVPADRGACTDVVVRSLRAVGVDLQREIHEDMVRRYDDYPHIWTPRRPDRNIDHRRAKNHIVFFRRHALSLPTELSGKALQTWKPGDFVYWDLGNGLDHCGVISNVANAAGVPLVIHNIGQARQEDCLGAWRITAHFRYPSH